MNWRRPETKALIVISGWFSLLIPLWFYTVSTYRAPVDYDRISRYESDIQSLLKTTVPVRLVYNTPEHFPDLQKAADMVVHRRLKNFGIHNWTIDFNTDNPDALEVRLYRSDDAAYHVQQQGRLVELSYDFNLLQNGYVPDMIADVLLEQVFYEELLWFSGAKELASHVASFSPMYHVSFSVFYGGGVPRIPFDTTELISKVGPLVKALRRSVANITIDSQVEFYAHIGCDPEWNETSQSWTLQKDDLSTFVNFAEWNLASTVPEPVLNFVVYIPDESQVPLTIQGSKTNSFLIPQWGGVFVLNEDDNNAVETANSVFQSQLMALLGAPTEPRSSQLRVDALGRMMAARAVLATTASLASLKRLAEHMPDIAIPDQVNENCKLAFKFLDDSLAAIKQGMYYIGTNAAGKAATFAEAAFFDKRMVAQTFVPQEHKLATYMPLLGPIGLLLFQRWVQVNRLRGKEIQEKMEQARQTAQKLKIPKAKKE